VARHCPHGPVPGDSSRGASTAPETLTTFHWEHFDVTRRPEAHALFGRTRDACAFLRAGHRRVAVLLLVTW